MVRASAASASTTQKLSVIPAKATTSVANASEGAAQPPPHLRPLYPTIAVSDACFCLANIAAVYWMWANGQILAALGFGIVALATFFGVLGFGVSAWYFATINSHFAELSAYVGLPLVGLTADLRAYAHHKSNIIGSVTPSLSSSDLDCVLVVGLVAIYTIIRGAFSEKGRDALKVPFNVVCFLLPCLNIAYAGQNWEIALAIGLIVFASVGVGADRTQLFMGYFLRENVFHYLMAIATLMLSCQLKELK